MRRVRGAGLLSTLALLLGWLVLAPTAAGGATDYVTTHGISMEPRFHTGDLALVRAADHYRVGDVVAYHSKLLDTVVLHRIVAEHDGRYTFKGDNNSWLDRERPTEQQLIGRLALRVPRGGIWLERLTSPVALGMLAFALVATGGTATARRRSKRHGRRRSTVSTHASHRKPARPLGPTSSSPRLSAVVTASAGLCALGVALGAVAWAVPASAVETVQVPTGRAVTFSYRAPVPPSAAYDDTVVRSPDPVFRKLTRAVEVRYAYRGSPGSVSVAADLSAPNGWHSTLQLAPRRTFTGSSYRGHVSLDLAAIDRRVEQAALAIGMPIDQLTLVVRPDFRTAHEVAFAPGLSLLVTPTTVSVAGEAALAVADAATTPRDTTRPRTFHLAGRELTVRAARVASLAVALGALLALIAARLVGTWTAPATEGAAIRRRYAANLLSVEPMAVPSHRPLVEVRDFETLASVAQRYGLLILHWTRADVETFLVHDDSATYRYRTGNGVDAPTPTPAEASVLETGETV